MNALTVPTVPDRCQDCGWVSNYGGGHWCNPEHRAPVTACRPMCWYCWAPVDPIIGRYGQLKGWPPYCSDTCRKLGSRPYGARLTAATVALVEQVAGSSSKGVAA